MIAGTNSGMRKTTVTCAVLQALVNRKINVSSFKCGPDYIDTKYHTAVCGRASINLDTFMASGEHVCELYARHAVSADVCIVEG